MDHHAVVEQLKACYYPFTLLSGSRLQEASDCMEYLPLAAGQRIHPGSDRNWDCIYVLDGRLRLLDATGSGGREVGARDTQRRPLVLTYLPAGTLIEAAVDSRVCLADSEILDYLLFWDEAVRQLGADDADMRDRIDSIRRASVFVNLPWPSVFSLIRRMHARRVPAGEDIVRQGEPGDSYYLLASGTAEVWETGLYDDEPVRVNELHAGDAFGEHALLTGGTRSATVRMVSDGELLVLEKPDFDRLVRDPVFREVDAQAARRLLADGWELIDVRYAEEYDDSHVPGSRLVPLNELRQQMHSFRNDGKYVVLCRSGKRSAVASLLLNQRAIESVSLKGGLIEWPYDTVPGTGSS